MEQELNIEKDDIFNDDRPSWGDVADFYASMEYGNVFEVNGVLYLKIANQQEHPLLEDAIASMQTGKVYHFSYAVCPENLFEASVLKKIYYKGDAS